MSYNKSSNSSSSNQVPIYLHASKVPKHIRDTTDYEWIRGFLRGTASTLSLSTISTEKVYSIEILQDRRHKNVVLDVSFRDSLEENKFLLRANLEEESRLEEDLIHLTHLHEPAVVETLQTRYNENLIYTATGPILLALNPFRNLPELYNASAMQRYYGKAGQQTNNNHNEDVPHVYRTADVAYRSMLKATTQRNRWESDNILGDLADQSILVSGESGAGKTMTTKFIMAYLARVSHQSHQVGSSEISDSNENLQGIEQQVLQSNPILESFGNARTIRNDNSSRFGKFIEIHFQDGELIGANIETYLLEKVRLVTQSTGERNYHIFYEMLDGMTDSEKAIFHLDSTATSAEDFYLTNQSGTFIRRDQVKDSESYLELLNAFNTMEFDNITISSITTIAASILHLGNIHFQDDGNERSVIHNQSAIYHLQCAANLLGVEAADLQSIVTAQTIITPSETISSPLNPENSVLSLQALFKGIYKAMFDWIVRKINEVLSNGNNATSTPSKATLKRNKSSAYIGILDIFGFESFEQNSFEQLCINYTNETLQHQFNNFILSKEQLLYENEGISWEKIEYGDNLEVLECIAGSQIKGGNNSGLFNVLDEQCRLPKTTDSTFFNALHVSISKNSSKFLTISNSQFPRQCFSVHHYAGRVDYSASGFLVKNQDSAVLSYDAVHLFRNKCSNFFIKEQLLPFLVDNEEVNDSKGMSTPVKTPTKRSKSSNINKMSVSAQFREQLKSLRQKIEATSPHYVRCLKPNDELIPDHFVPNLIAQQLRCAGVLEAVRVSRLGYPQRYNHIAFYDRYKVLCPSIALDVDIENRCDQLIEFVKVHISENIKFKGNGNVVNDEGLNTNTIQIGRTKVFLRQTAFDYIEEWRLKKLYKSAIVAQAFIRKCICMSRFERTIRSITTIQSIVRMALATRKVLHRRKMHAATRIQSLHRKFHARKHYYAVFYIASWTQRLLRGKMARKQYWNLISHLKAILIQKCVRMNFARQRFFLHVKSVIRIQCCYRRVTSREKLKKLRMEAKDLFRIREENEELKRQILFYKEQISLPSNQTTNDALTKKSITVDNDIYYHDSLHNELITLQKMCDEKDEDIWRLQNEITVLRANTLVTTVQQTEMAGVNEELDNDMENKQLRKEILLLSSISSEKDEKISKLQEEIALIRTANTMVNSIKGDPFDDTGKVNGTEEIKDERDIEIEKLRNEILLLKRSMVATGSLSFAGDVSEPNINSTAPPLYKTPPPNVNANIESLSAECGTASDAKVTPSSSPVQKAIAAQATGIKHRLEGIVGFLTGNTPTYDRGIEANTKSPTDRQETPIHAAVYAHDEVALLNAIDQCNELDNGNIQTNDIIQSMVNGAPQAYDVAVEMNRGDYEGKTPLHIATALGDLKMGTVLLHNMAVSNAQDKYGNTPLHFAKDPSLMRLLLLTGGANPNIPNENGLCALHLAVTRRDVGCVRTLLEHGADVNVADDIHWYTPLHLIAQRHTYSNNTGNDRVDEKKFEQSDVSVDNMGEIAALICGVENVEMNYQDYQGNTPLHHAAILDENDGGSVMKIFLNAGADPNMKNTRGQTPLLLFCYNQSLREYDYYLDLLKLLLDRGAKVNLASSQSGCTPLHLALYYRDIESAILLVRRGAQLNVPWKRPKSWSASWTEHNQNINDIGTEKVGDVYVLPWDMLPDQTLRYRILNAIATEQQWCNPGTGACMQCKNPLRKFGKHHCRNCGRCICGRCSPTILDKNFFPNNIHSKLKPSKGNRGNIGFRVCLECEGILRARKGIDMTGYMSTPNNRQEHSNNLQYEYLSNANSGKDHTDTDINSVKSNPKRSPDKNFVSALKTSNVNEAEFQNNDAMEQYRSVVLGLLCEAAPEEVANVDHMILVFRGREQELLDLLRVRKEEKHKLRMTVIDVLRKCAPNEVANADEMIRVFHGREDELLDILKRMEATAATKPIENAPIFYA